MPDSDFPEIPTIYTEAEFKTSSSNTAKKKKKK